MILSGKVTEAKMKLLVETPQGSGLYTPCNYQHLSFWEDTGNLYDHRFPPCGKPLKLSSLQKIGEHAVSRRPLSGETNTHLDVITGVMDEAPHSAKYAIFLKEETVPLISFTIWGRKIIIPRKEKKFNFTLYK